MSKIEKKVKKIVEEKTLNYNNLIKIIRENSQSDCIQKFEEKLFGEFEKWYGDTVEKDTDYEKKLFHMLRQFVDGAYVGTSKKHMIDSFKELLNCKNKYDEILKPDNLDNIFRGEKMELESIKNENWELIKQWKYMLTYETILNYEPRDTIQSWTTSSVISSNFAFKEELKNPSKYPVELEIHNPNEEELLFDPQFLNKIQYNENEVIRISDKTLRCKAKLYLSTNNAYEHFFINQNKNIIEPLKEIDPEIEERLSYI